jgi:hypothetical protein
MAKKKTKKVYLLFDGRYHSDPDRAICLEMCESLSEARESINDYGDAVIVQFDDNKGVLENEKIIY